MDKRDAVLDILKGVGILFVVYAHVCKNSTSTVLYLFHMPLFFFLTGAAMSFSTVKALNVKKRITRIIKPYIVFSIFSFFYWAFIESRFRPIHNSGIFPGILGNLDIKWQQLINIPLAVSFEDAFQYNIVLWYLPCLFVSIMLYVFISNLFGRFKVAGVLISTLLGFLLMRLRLPWCFEIALIAVPFLYIGNMLYGYLKSRPFIGLLGFLLSIVLIIIFCPSVDMRTHQYGEWWLFYIVSLGLIASTISLCYYFEGKEFGVIQWLGRNSLAIMCIHEPIKRIMLVIIAKCFSVEVSVLRESVLFSLGSTIVIIGVLVPIVLFINKYIPSVVGNSHKS